MATSEPISKVGASESITGFATITNSLIDKRNWSNRTDVSAATYAVDDGGDDQMIYADASSNTISIEMPASADVPGMMLIVYAEDASNVITLTLDGSDTANGSASDPTLSASNTGKTLFSTGDGDWMMIDAGVGSGGDVAGPGPTTTVGAVAYYTDTGGLTIGEDGTTLVVDSVNKRVGVGGTPTDDLHVQGGFASATIEPSSTGAESALRLKNADGAILYVQGSGSTVTGTILGLAKADKGELYCNAGYDGMVIRTGGTNPIYLGTNDTLALTVDGTTQDVTIENDLIVDTTTLVVDSANNRVGIGTTSPGEELHVYRLATSATALVESALVSGSATNQLLHTGKTILQQIYGASATGTTYGISNARLAVINTNGSNFIIGTSGAAKLYLGTNSTIALTIDGSTQAATFAAPISAAIESGATGSRPGSPIKWQMYGDDTLGIPIWHDGSNWVDATGTTV